MKSIWLGQGGLLIISGKLKIMIDPYQNSDEAEESIPDIDADLI